jgi:hypothetical protein
VTAGWEACRSKDGAGLERQPPEKKESFTFASD